MSCKRLDEDSVARWKQDMRGPYIRLIVLDEKAEDNGLTDEERAEYDRLKTYAEERLRDLLVANGF